MLASVAFAAERQVVCRAYAPGAGFANETEVFRMVVLVFGYDMSEDGVVTVRNLWLKKVWEICRPMQSGSGKNKVIWPLNLQIKQGVVHKIRPAKWYGVSRSFKLYRVQR